MRLFFEPVVAEIVSRTRMLGESEAVQVWSRNLYGHSTPDAGL